MMAFIAMDSAKETISMDGIDAVVILFGWLMVREEIMCSVQVRL